RGVVHGVQTRPEDGTEAHGTGLARGIMHRAYERECFHSRTRASNRDHLRVRGRIVGRDAFVAPFAHYVTSPDHDGAEGATESPASAVGRQCDVAGDVAFVAHGHPRAMNSWISVCAREYDGG